MERFIFPVATLMYPVRDWTVSSSSSFGFIQYKYSDVTTHFHIQASLL